MKTLVLVASLFTFQSLFAPTSFSFGFADLDPQLIGMWMYTINASSGSGRTFVDKVTRIKWVFHANGTFERGASLEKSITKEAARKSNEWSAPTERGTWHTDGGKIYITSINGQALPEDRQLSGSYYIEGNTMVFTGTDGKKAIWHR